MTKNLHIKIGIEREITISKDDLKKELDFKNEQNEKTTTEWEKICANVMSDKGLISKIYKQLI